jgi:hypothetical protein
MLFLNHFKYNVPTSAKSCSSTEILQPTFYINFLLPPLLLCVGTEKEVESTHEHSAIERDLDN